MMPFCLLSGFLFTFLAGTFTKEFRTNMIHKTYSAESAGSVAGGIIVSFILVYFLKSLQILGFFLIVNIIIILIMRRFRGASRSEWILIMTGLVSLILIYGLNLDKLIQAFSEPGACLSERYTIWQPGYYKISGTA
jgi:hypothetical protein